MEKPPDISFSGVTPTWVVALARWFVWHALRDHSSVVVERLHECWVDQHLALYVRYSYRARTASGIRSKLAGVRFEGFDVDRLSGLPLAESHPISAMTQASNLYLGELGGGPPRSGGWTDALGYPWYGDHPEYGWERAVTGDRLETVLAREP